MSNIWFSSDLHLCHNQPFIYEKRGFTNIEEMNECIVNNWNQTVQPDDTVFLLGDVCLYDMQRGIEFLQQLHGNINLILGNHDQPSKQELFANIPNIMNWGYANVFKYKKINFFLSHYPTLTDNFDTNSHFNQHVINLHGHTHHQNNFLNINNPFMYHVGVDSHNMQLVHIDTIISDIRLRWYQLMQEDIVCAM